MAYCEEMMAKHGEHHVPTKEELKDLAEILTRTLHPYQIVAFFAKLFQIPVRDAVVLALGNGEEEEDEDCD